MRGLLCRVFRPGPVRGFRRLFCPPQRRIARKPNKQRGDLSRPFEKLLLAKTQLLDQRVIPLHILLLEIGEKVAALVDHHEEAATRVVVLVVGLEMLGQVADAFGQDGDLNFRRPRIALGDGIVLDDLIVTHPNI